MPIYTKTGDKGETSLFGGGRISKSDSQIEAYGQLDELSSFIGLIISKIEAVEEKNFLTTIQKDLYHIVSSLSGAPVQTDSLKKQVTIFEKRIDFIEEKLPKLNRFILPQGNEISSLFHIARSVCRRTERAVVRYLEKFNPAKSGTKFQILEYLNRLSDLLFMLARFYNISEITV